MTCPLDVLKTRIMLERREGSTGSVNKNQAALQGRKGAAGIVRQVMQDEGWRGFFRGFVPRIGWISTGGAIFLGTYQWAANRLGERGLGVERVLSQEPI